MRISHSFLGGWTLLSVLVSLVQVHGEQTCYFHDGSVAADDIPCTGLTNLNDANVPCCAANSTCMENRMCYSPNTVPHLSRGSCTDWHWNSGNCPQFCLKNATGVQIWNCTIHDGLRSSSGEAEYCCLTTADEDCCTQPGQLFTAADWTFTNSPTSSASSATPSTASTKKASSGTNYQSIGIGVGVGVGVTVVLVAIATVGLFWFRRRRRRGHQSVGSSSSADSNPHFQPPVQERGPAAYSDNIDGRATGTRSYELASAGKPLELHGSEPQTRDLDTLTPRILRPSSVDKMD